MYSCIVRQKIGILTVKINLHQKASFLVVSEKKMILVTDFKGFR